jgi:lipopolysaccharide export system permease protein
MKVLDRYILRELIVPILYACFTLIFLILIADLFNNLDELLRHKTPIMIFLRYYAAMVPFAFIQIIPWATWLGMLFLLVHFGFHNELIAMKVAGIKIMTIVRPALFLGFLIGIGTFIISDRVVPKSYRTANELREIYIEKKKDAQSGKILHNVTYESSSNQIYFFRTFQPAKEEAEDVIILSLDPEGHKTRQKISAKRAVWTGSAWQMEGVMEHQMDSRGHLLGDPLVLPKKIYPELTATAKDIANTSRESVYLSYREMKQSMKKLKESGVSIYSELVDLHYRLASPWQSLVMILIAIPLLGRTRTRKGIAASMLICVGVIFAYHFVDAIALALGKSGKILPFASAWFSNIAFTIGALMTIDKANH